eukprot:TRINITY_DN1650_c0_g2_i1.p1 TRINITY_DN1650_c0_g2~~TRINITY_DN1650_c0_g2_i1.p1  ORF type:complete len:297 (-),score=74.89 TRINITY_DN1650_c0_g2_i1:44-934(-)
MKKIKVKKIENYELVKRERIFVKLFKELENVGVGCSPFEKLPKLILTLILQFLDAKDMAQIFRLNKFFFKFLWTSPNSGMLWEKMCVNQQEGEKINEKEVEEFIKNNPTSDQFEKKMNRFLFYFKHCAFFEWDPQHKEDVFEIYQKTCVVYERASQKRPINGPSWTIPSKNIFKGKTKKVELLCSFSSLNLSCMCFGVITSNYVNWNDYTHYVHGGKFGTGEASIPNELDLKKGVNDIKILIDIENRKMKTYCLKTQREITLTLSNLVNIEDGIRFAVSFSFPKDFFEVKKMRTFH